MKDIKLPKCIQGEIVDLNNAISFKEIESIINNLSTKGTTKPRCFTSAFYQTFKGEIIPVLHKLFSKMKAGGLPNSFCEANITLISNLNKERYPRKENHKLVSLMNIDVKS